MQTSVIFTEKPKSREDQVADEAEKAAYQEKNLDLDLDDDDDFNDGFSRTGMNDYIPYAGYEGGAY